MLAVVPVRDGVLPAGGDEAIAECDGAGDPRRVGPRRATEPWPASPPRCASVELGDFAPDRWSGRSPPLVDDDVVVLPASPDGRDLAPRLAHRLGRPLLAGAVAVTPGRGHGSPAAAGLELHARRRSTSRSSPRCSRGCAASSRRATGAAAAGDVTAAAPAAAPVADAALVRVLPPDVATMDLAEAARIVGGGAGLDERRAIPPARRRRRSRSARRWARRG